MSLYYFWVFLHQYDQNTTQRNKVKRREDQKKINKETTQTKTPLSFFFFSPVSCPPEWIKDNELCFLYKGGSFRFVEAQTYCQVSTSSCNCMN